MRVEGSVFDPSRPQPPDTRPLYHWWSPSRADNFLTTTNFGGEPDYGYFRLEGYVYATPVAGTVPVTSWWAPGKVDNKITADPRIATGAPYPGNLDYQFVRTEGYILPPAPAFDPQPPFDSAMFGYGLRSNSGQPVRGNRPLLVILTSFTNPGYQFPPDRPASYYDDLMFGGGAGPNHWTVPAYFSEVSNRQFAFQRANVLGPFSMGTFPTTEAELPRYAANSLNAAAAAGFAFWTYDVNRDRILTRDELAVIIINAQLGNCGSMRGHSPVTFRQPDGQILTLDLSVIHTDRAVGFATLVHELTHQLGDALDLYGNQWNAWKSLMGSTCGGNDVHHTLHLDPWHKIQFGWLKPRVVPFDSRGTFPGQALPLIAPTEASGPDATDPFAYVLLDPVRGPFEYFILEYRMRRGYDASVALDTSTTEGLAIWHVKTDSYKQPKAFRTITAGADMTLETRTSGDDYSIIWDPGAPRQSLAIMPGSNWILNSTLAPTDEYSEYGRSMLFIGAPHSTLGFGSFWRASNGVNTGLRWFDLQPTGLRLRVLDASTTNPTRIVVEWNMESPLGLPPQAARLDLAPPSALRGQQIRLHGVFGAVRGARQVKLGSHTLQVTRWSSLEIEAQIPTGIPAGTYQLRVESNASVRSNALNVNVFN